jgi:hypothetical protein
MPEPDVKEKLRKLAAISPCSAEFGWLFYLSGEGDERNSAEELLDILAFQNVHIDYRKRICLDPPLPALCQGEYNLGTVIYPPGSPYCAFGLREDEWIKHLLIVGMTGSGKTNLSFQILSELRRKNKPALIFDWKRNYRDLVQRDEFRDMRVFTVGRDVASFHFNPLLPPPGLAPGIWLMKLVDVIKHAYFVGEGVEYLLRDSIDNIYETCGLYGGRITQAPNLYQVKAHVYSKHLQGRMSLWRASALRVLESLCFYHGLGPVLNTATQWDYEKLLQKTVVMELDALSDADKIFFTEAMILWLYELRKQERNREQFKHALLIEEGHHILSQAKENHEGIETIMETSLRQIREFGEAVIVIDQEPTKLSNSIKANTYCKIVFNLGNGKDKEDIARCLGLNAEEREYIDLLPVGHAIVSLKRTDTLPVHMVCPWCPVKKGVIQDEDLRGRSH